MPASNRRTALSLAAIAVGMLMLAYASVPLYRLFCAVTGFGGTTQRVMEEKAERAAHHIQDRIITVRFNADTDPGLPWKFTPNQKSVTVRVGETMLASYTAENLSDKPVTGQAVYNVTPHKTGAYFDKIACFCFENQTLKPGEKVNMPISFFIDPALMDDKDMNDIQTITLSYTFFALKR